MGPPLTDLERERERERERDPIVHQKGRRAQPHTTQPEASGALSNQPEGGKGFKEKNRCVVGSTQQATET